MADKQDQGSVQDKAQSVKSKINTSSVLHKRLSEAHDKEKREGYLDDQDFIKIINAAREEMLLSEKVGTSVIQTIDYMDLLSIIINIMGSIIREPVSKTLSLPQIKGNLTIKSKESLENAIMNRLKDPKVFQHCSNYFKNPNFLSCMLMSVADIVGKEHVDNIIKQLGSFANIPLTISDIYKVY